MAAEHKRSSLVDDSLETVGSKKAGKSSSGAGGNGLKIGLAIGCMVIAGILIAYQMGFVPNPFEEKVKPTIRTQEDSKAVQDYQKQTESSKSKPNMNQGGS